MGVEKKKGAEYRTQDKEEEKEEEGGTRWVGGGEVLITLLCEVLITMPCVPRPRNGTKGTYSPAARAAMCPKKKGKGVGDRCAS